MTSSARPRFSVAAQLSPTTSVQEVSKLFEGLRSLARTGQIALAIEPVRTPSHPRVVTLIVEESRGTRTIAIDLDDRPEPCSSELLQRADTYFKRSYRPGLVTAKVQPFGLSNPAIRPATALHMLGAGVRAGRPLRQLFRDARQLFALPSPADFESPPAAPADLLVLYQTRLWPLDGRDPGVAEVNEERVRLVCALRQTFGSRFVGGLVPGPEAEASHPDLITDLPCSMRSYPRLVKRALVGVSTRGLRGSVGFKMSEYLAASRCIVSHPIDSGLPEPLVAGGNFLSFATPEECIAQCDALLGDPARARQMRARNWDYYRSQVEPAAHLLATLERSFD